MTTYKPEGALLDTPENAYYLRDLSTLREAFSQGVILEARTVLCDHGHDLIVDLGCTQGIIPRTEGAEGIEEGTTRDIALISRVGKPVCFQITGFEPGPDGGVRPVLSRRAVQAQCRRDYLDHLRPGDIIDARVTHLENFGCFVDIGCGIPSLIPIDAISISRISHPRDRFFVGQEIHAVVRYTAPDGKITLSHKEQLGTWEENASLFAPGETVAGVVRSVEHYGIFIELTPNLAGLAEPKEDVFPGQQASVFIKNILPEKMKVKLIIVDAFDAKYPCVPPRYFLPGSHMDSFLYSPACSDRVIRTDFAAP